MATGPAGRRPLGQRLGQMMTLRKFGILALALLALNAAASGQAAAQDKVAVGVFPVSSSLPYFVALERGFFKEQNIEPEMTKLMGGPPNVAAMMTNQIEVSAVLVTLEGLNANVKKPGVAMYIALNSQTKVWKMEQFVVRNGFKADSIADLKGAKLLSAPGPANLNTAKAILAKNGLKDGDYTIDQLDMSPKQIADLQKLADFGNSIGVVPEKIDVTKVLQKY